MELRPKSIGIIEVGVYMKFEVVRSPWMQEEEWMEIIELVRERRQVMAEGGRGEV